MSIDNFAVVNIASATATPTKVGFGTPLVLGYFTAWADRVRTYTNLTDMATDGITSTGVGAATYWTAAAIFGQSPRVGSIKVGRRTNAFTQKVKLIPTSAVAGVVYRWSIAPLGGSAVTFTRTVPGASSIAAELAAMKALIDAAAFSGMSTALADTNTTLECTAGTAGTVFVYAGKNVELEILESTTAPAAISTDLDACRVADDDWYGVAIDNSSKAENLIVAAWTQSQIKVFGSSTGDTENGKVGVSGTLLKQLKAAGYTRTFTLANYNVLPSFGGAAWIGESFPYDPGTEAGTYCAKTLDGITVDAPSTTAETETVAQNGNVYTVTAGENVTRPGKVASGEFIDVIIGKDWLTARIKEAVFGVQIGVRKVPYTDGGVSMLKAAALGVLVRAQGSLVKPGFLDPEVPAVVTAPKVADVDPAQRAARIFPSLAFSSKIAGAIHQAIFAGTITV